MKRGGPLARRAPLRRGSGLKKIGTGRRGGLWASEHAELRTMHTRVVMIRFHRFEMEKAKGGTGWWGMCEKHGGEGGWLCTSHVIPTGRAPSMAYDPDNAIPLCGPCHIHWWHKFPTDAAKWYAERYGIEKLAMLEARYLAIKEGGPKPSLGLARAVLVAELRRLTNGREPVEV